MIRKLKTITSLLLLCFTATACFAADSVKIPNTPEGTAETIVKSMADFKPQAAWNALPSKYQSDVKELIQLFTENMDKDVYDKGIATLDKLADIIKNKKEFIANSGLLKDHLEKNKVDVDEFKSGLESTAKIIGTLTKSDLGSIAKLKSLNPEKFLATTISQVLKTSYEVAQSLDNEEKLPDLEDIKKVKVTVVEKSDGKAKISVDLDDDEEEAKETTLVQVDGKWLPEEMVADWDKNIESAKSKLKEIKITPENKTQILTVFGAIDGMLSGLADAKTQEDFDKAVLAIVAAVSAGPGGGPPPAP